MRELVKRANARARELLAKHVVEPLDPDVVKSLMEVAQRLKERYH
jgi:trimethylamine:corrinoid methyltransferase-like protein